MLMKKQVPYELLKLAFFSLPLLFTVSCDKEEPIDPLKQKIEQLTKQSEIEAKELRAATTAALTQPYDIQQWYWNIFVRASELQPSLPQNLLDSAKVHVFALDDIYGKFGDPLEKNDENIKKFYKKSKTYITTMTELNKLQTK